MGAFEAQDLNPAQLATQLTAGKVWLPPYPGGAAEWITGYTPYQTMDRYQNDTTGVLSLGGPAFMVVAKFKGSLSHMTWYVLNQRTFLNGANDGSGCVNPACSPQGNCWGCRYGEVDILEGNYCEPNLCMTLTNGGDSTSGSCLFGETQTKPVFVPGTDGEDPLIAAVFDQQGVTVYINPVWDGLTETKAAAQLQKRPTSAQKIVKAPASEKGMWKDLQDTDQLDELGLSPKPRGNVMRQTCAAPGWDVTDGGLYSVATPVQCCRGQTPVNMSGELRCPGGVPFPGAR